MLAGAAGWPVLADLLSVARGAHAIAHYDALLRSADFADAMRPEAVLRVGDLPTSAAAWQLSTLATCHRSRCIRPASGTTPTA